jgi:hypothetical protein
MPGGRRGVEGAVYEDGGLAVGCWVLSCPEQTPILLFPSVL